MRLSQNALGTLSVVALGKGAAGLTEVFCDACSDHTNLNRLSSRNGSFLTGLTSS